MRHSHLYAAVAAILAIAVTAPAAGQSWGTQTIGTEPSSAYTLLGLGMEVTSTSQSFVVPSNAISLKSFSFWLEGEVWGDYIFLAGVNREPVVFGWVGGSGYYPRTSFGRLTLSLDMPVTPNEVLWFEMYTNNFEEFASVRVVPGTSYDDGELYQGYPPEGLDDTGYDLLFTADFSATPEPISLVLLGTGLAGLGALRRRKRR